MRINVTSYLKIVLFFFALNVLVMSQNAHAEKYIFQRSLRTGMTGEDVRELQKILNQNPKTAIISNGPGSPGQETSYFGALTKAAVVRFQGMYPDAILRPNGLAVGTGIVGFSTRTVLNNLSLSKISESLSAIPSNPPIKPVTNQVSDVTKVNNSKNLDIFLAQVERVSKEKGVPTETINQIKGQITRDVATSTNLQEKFLKIVQKNIVSFMSDDSLVSSKKGQFDSILAKIFQPKVAHAQGAGTPFGGAVLFSYYCACSANWLITIEPLPPSFVALLTYTTGSQGYLSYNIPFTPWLLGSYSQGPQCSIYAGTSCATVASEGWITPMVGSAL